jgi:PAS domain S-box-containing protein
MVGFENPDECLMNIHDIAQDIFVERNQYDEIKKKILKSGGLTETESILRKKDGSVFIGNLVVKPIFDEKGQPNFYEGIIEDITEKKKYQEEIIRTNNLLEGIINTSPDMVSIIDLENKRFSYISPRCKDILYYDRTDLMLENNPFKTLIFEEDMPSMHKHRDKFLKLGNNDTLSTDVRFVRKDGQIIWVNVKDQVYERNDEGTPIKSVNIITEITARKLAEEQLKKSERKFRDIFNNSIDGIAILNKSFRFLDINKSFINHTGYSREKILNENLKNLIFPEGFERLAGSFDDNGNVLINTVEVELMASEGSFPAEISSRNIIYNDEKCIISIIRDITERKHFEREMLDTIIQTEEKERERFARNLHDDLGPLLSSIKMYMNSFEGTDDHTKQRFIIDQVNDILKESIQTTKIISNDLSPHILTNYGLISAVESFIEKLNPHLSIQFSDNINDRRFHNSLETTFYRIIKELVNNTIKHANAQNVYINLLHQESELILTYSDDGVGFDLKTIEKNEKRGMGLFNLISRIKSLNGKFIMKDVKQGVLFEIIAPTID